MQPSKRWGRLRARIIIWAFAPTLLVLAVVAGITLLAYERLVQEEVVGRERERTYFAANRLKEELNKFSAELSALARTEAIYQGSPAGQRSALLHARRRLSVFDGGVILLDNFGRILSSQPARPEIYGEDWSARPYFGQLLSGEPVFFSNALQDGPAGAPVVVVAVPVISLEGEFLGAVAGMFRLGEPTVSPLYASLVRLRMGDRAYLVDGNGLVIYHPEAEQIGQKLPADPIVEQVLAGQGGAYRVENGDQEDLVIAAAPVPGTPWGLITEEAWATAASPSRGYGRFLLVLLVLGILLPAGWFGLLARQRRAEAVERAHMEHQLQVARLIQQTLLPRDAPDVPGWHMSGHYQPAQAVGGDFYDFLYFEDGQMGLVIGDVTDKGVPAALVMATTRSLLRTLARQVRRPGQVLAQVNELLTKEIPPRMFVTCLYAILDPATGRLVYANAGHNLPYRSQPDNGRTVELRARGMPLGLMPDMVYEEMDATIEAGECIIFYSDGLVEAHNPQREMFGTARLRNLLGHCNGDCPALIQHLLAELEDFTGKAWEQEDDVTLVTLQRTGTHSPDSPDLSAADWRTLAAFALPSEPGGERQAVQLVTEAVRGLGLPPPRLERLKTAVGEAAMNGIEHGNEYRSELKLGIEVLHRREGIMVRITDQGGGKPILEPETPNLEAKIAGVQSPRGWGLFLIEHMVDEMRIVQDEEHHTVELILLREGENNANQPD